MTAVAAAAVGGSSQRCRFPQPGSWPAAQYGLKIDGATPRGVPSGGGGGFGVGVGGGGAGSLAAGGAGACGSALGAAAGSSGAASWDVSGVTAAGAAGAAGKRAISCALLTQPLTPS